MGARRGMVHASLRISRFFRALGVWFGLVMAVWFGYSVGLVMVGAASAQRHGSCALLGVFGS
jgi:hypothetical protein